MNGTRVKQDRRVDRTVSSLRKALTELILEKHYDLITVQDIIDRANVGRYEDRAQDALGRNRVALGEI